MGLNIWKYQRKEAEPEKPVEGEEEELENPFEAPRVEPYGAARNAVYVNSRGFDFYLNMDGFDDDLYICSFDSEYPLKIIPNHASKSQLHKFLDFEIADNMFGLKKSFLQAQNCQ